MLSPSLIGDLMNSPVQAGELKWIGVRPIRRAPMQSLPSANLAEGHGIEGDHYETKHKGARQVTLIGIEDLTAIASFLGLKEIGPELLRRNLVTSGINLLALKDRKFLVGSALLEMSGICAPCSRMEETFGSGGYNAVRGHGGITARILQGGKIAVGNLIERADGFPPKA